MLATQPGDWRIAAFAAAIALAAWRTRAHALLLIGAGGAAGALGWI